MISIYWLIVPFIFGYILGLVMSRTKASDLYWKGRSEGWMACEQMILERAKKVGGEPYKKEIWEQLVQ